jgi:DNA-directed RNA polymerase sigma subunit (sigma70/sigma32)
MSQAAVAKLLGVSRGRIYQLERAALAKIRRAIERDARKQGISVEDWLSQFDR